MSIELDPPELGFRRPFTHEVTQVLGLKNLQNEQVAFKVKTTAPKQYCVRPNSGLIQPGGEVKVQVLLQAMKEDPPLDARCRDKFLVQSVAIGADQDVDNLAATWSGIEKTSRDSIKERKIRVTFLPAHGSTPQHNNVNGIHSGNDMPPPAYSSPSPTFGSPVPDAVTPHAKSFEPKDSANSSTPLNPSAALNTVASAASNATSSAGETLQQQLDAARATIAQLKSQAEEQGLKQRKSDAVVQDSRERITTGTTGMGVHEQAVSGVPVQMVAALCLLSFLLAYLFF